LGTNDDRREGPPLGEPGGSPRRDEVDDFLTSAGEDALLRLIVLELRRIGLGATPGEAGLRCSSDGRRGEFTPGDCGRGTFVAVWSDSRFTERERRFASLFVCRAPLGVPGLGAGDVCWWGFCMATVSGRVATRVSWFPAGVWYRVLVGERDVPGHDDSLPLLGEPKQGSLASHAPKRAAAVFTA
jgi:hypothetical protein